MKLLQATGQQVSTSPRFALTWVDLEMPFPVDQPDYLRVTYVDLEIQP